MRTDLAAIFPDFQGLNQAAFRRWRAAAAKYPANDTTIGDGMNTGGYRFNATTPVRLHSHSAKMDFNLTSHQTLFVRANVIYDKWGGVPAYPDTPAPDEWDHPWGFAVGHTWTIHNNLVNNFRYGYTRQAFTKGGDLIQTTLTSASFTTRRRAVFLVARDPGKQLGGRFELGQGQAHLSVRRECLKDNNIRTSYSNAFDHAITNPSYYLTNLLRAPLSNFVVARMGFRCSAATDRAPRMR